MRYDGEHKARTRDRVLQEAVKAIRDGGPAALGVAGVMQRAGLTHGGFYAHFGSRDELLLAAVAEMFGAASGMFARRTADLSPSKGLQDYVRFYLSRSHRDARDAGCPLPVLASDLPRLPQAARERFEQGLARLNGDIADVLRRLGRPDPEALASSALAEMIGALGLSRAVADVAQSDLILARSRRAVLERLGLAEDVS